MKEKIEFNINQLLITKFNIALQLSGEDGNQLLEEWISKYIKMVFTKEAGIEMVLESSDNNTVNKIRKWALKDNFPHKIIKVFLKCYNRISA